MAAEVLGQGIPVDFTKVIDRSILKGRTALVTGAGSGIGLSIATALAESGANVTFADVNEAGALKAVEALKQQGHNAQFVRTDVTSWDEQAAAFALASKTSPENTVDILVTAAGIRPMLENIPHPSKQDTPIKPPTATLDVNLTGTFYSTHLAQWYFTHSPPNPAKQILFISSMAGYTASLRANVGYDYTTSKYGVRGLWQHLRAQSDLHGGARFNLLAPFFIDTPMLRKGDVESMRARGLKVGTLADVVDGALRCLCDVEVTGRGVVIAGGEDNGGAPGTANFDLLDENRNMLGGKALLANVGKFFVEPSVK